LSYQWNRNGSAIAGALSSTYTFVTGPSTSSDTYTVTVTNFVAANSTSAYVTTAPVTVTTSNSLTINTPVNGLSATIGYAYSLSVSAQGGSAPYLYSLASGASALTAAGLSFNTATGLISGTPTQTGTLNLVVAVTDTNSATAATNSFAIVIGLDPDAPTPTFSSPVATSDGFTVIVTNYSSSFVETATVNTGVITNSIPSGSNWLLTVSGLLETQTATVTVTAGAVGYVSESASITFGPASQAPAATPVPVPDPPQRSEIDALKPTTAVAGPTPTVVFMGTFIEKVDAIEVNTKFIDHTLWTQTDNTVTVMLPFHTAGTYEIQIYNGSAPVLKSQTFTLTAPAVVPAQAPKIIAPEKMIYISCVKGSRVRIAYGILPTCPVGYVKR
jgi:hypothetical protein